MAEHDIHEALGRFNKSMHEEPDGDEAPRKEHEDGHGKGHAFHVHKHKDGTHHLTVHGEHGQLMHHSEHPSLEEAAEEMKAHDQGE